MRSRAEPLASRAPLVPDVKHVQEIGPNGSVLRGFYRTVLHPFPVLHATHGMQRRHEKKRMTIPLLGFDLVLTRGLRAAVQSGRAHGRTLAFSPYGGDRVPRAQISLWSREWNS